MSWHGVALYRPHYRIVNHNRLATLSIDRRCQGTIYFRQWTKCAIAQNNGLTRLSTDGYCPEQTDVGQATAIEIF